MNIIDMLAIAPYYITLFFMPGVKTSINDLIVTKEFQQTSPAADLEPPAPGEEVDAEDDGGGGGERGRLGAERVEHGAVPCHHLFIVVTMHCEGPYTHRGYRLDVKRNMPHYCQFVRTLSGNRVPKRKN